MRIRENVLISSLTTMRLGGQARYVIEIETIDDIAKAYNFAKEHDLPTWIMGGGANTLSHDEGFNGVILLNKLKGIQNIAQNDCEVTIRSMGGEKWDDLVQYTCDLGYSGIEALSLIPGTVGAAPVQNIGAYGQELAQVIKNVEAYDTQEGKIITLQKPEMKLGYRNTRFNHGEDAGRFFIIAITIVLQKKTLRPPFYNSLQRYIDQHQETDFSPQNIRRMVIEIRNSKLPDPDYIASAGSFFKNVRLSKDEADKLVGQDIPMWRNEDGTGKINSGWLIEQCGLSGKKMRGIRVSDKASLVLINEDAKSYADLDAARAEIIGAVAEKFGIVLEQEPVEIPKGAKS